jgi:hypothetical protein
VYDSLKVSYPSKVEVFEINPNKTQQKIKAVEHWFKEYHVKEACDKAFS